MSGSEHKPFEPGYPFGFHMLSVDSNLVASAATVILFFIC